MTDRWEWHPSVSERFDEALQFIFLGFGPVYSRELIFGLFREFFAAKGVTRYRYHEVFGPYDIILRAWLPATLDRRLNVDQSLIEFLESHGARVEIHASFHAHEYLYHWCWPQSGPVPAPAAKLNPTLLNEIQRTHDVQRAKYLCDSGLLNILPAQTPSIRFFMTMPESPLRVPEKQANGLYNDLVAALKSHSGISEPVFYKGFGTRTHLLLEGTVAIEEYLNISGLSAAFFLKGIDRFDLKTTTYLTPGPIESSFESEGHFSSPPSLEIAIARDARDFLIGDENETLERKGSLEIDLDTYLSTGTIKREPKITDKILATIVGFLNHRGGDVVIGALEDTRIRPDGRARADLLPLISGHRVCGLEIASDGKKFDWDRFARKIGDLCSSRIGDSNSPYVSFHSFLFEDRHLCAIHVEPLPRGTAAYLDGKFFVRTGSSTRELFGTEQAEYQRKRAIETQ